MIARPLKPQYFQILLALASRELHGYAIQRAVLEQTDDQMRLWPAMLYRSLTKLEEGGLIRSTEPPEDEPEDERRQYYALTDAGRERLREEAETLARWARQAGAAEG
jgi:DNA-binding PadR family transcriptional regulator